MYAWLHTNTNTAVLVYRRLRIFEKSDYSFRHVCTSDRMEQFGFHWKIFMKFDIWVIFENL